MRQRARGTCEDRLLPERFSGLPHTLDHIIARQHGGDDRPGNLALACQRCNRLKDPNPAGLDPASGELHRLIHPERDAWSDHLRLDAAEITGVSPKAGPPPPCSARTNPPASPSGEASCSKASDWVGDSALPSDRPSREGLKRMNVPDTFADLHPLDAAEIHLPIEFYGRLAVGETYTLEP